ncbi:putative cathepsin B5 cysteine protease [Monocercomonoides exilis]|uniref:putative cathepsin B5 cysteine protease n=1 Tax=Monocercomonoides exilis TaxID=2049356 RepID=UPI00355A55F8|nr:putative cathepsin B5 cysteine protease [Monocercomonoides exilis]|eukprot:MONOS_13403.1-p1 / transcript=MONOS_13403.1 / gene=MONOS_13403 / organism=Monocercomonoides_exilis_PA203 / gene_product=cathepsin B5 cysteine protease / transcript_product=cathepsin B5 cysteine protease / location=Mono_scaffold00822:25148-26023(+) / protein_length=291 / sequence_SO=supercontig / SO=protein_coding / is_pseudo=false
MNILTVLLISSLLAKKHIVEYVNNNPLSTWTAEENKFSMLSTQQLRSMFNQEIVKDLKKDLHSHVEEDPNSPESFDAREEWPNAIHPIRDQKKCGSCWAFAGTEVLSDRFAVMDHPVGVLSPQDLVSCDMLDHGCNGGSPLLEWTWMALRGVTTDECIPYVSGNGTVPRCPRKCSDGSVIVRHKAKTFSFLPSLFIQSDLMRHGPQEFCFMVYEDFMSYKKGVYQHQTGELLGGHAVKSVGWGVEGGVKYWLLANSWGSDWGEKGFFKILRGKNECSIESMVYAGVPKVDE